MRCLRVVWEGCVGTKVVHGVWSRPEFIFASATDSPLRLPCNVYSSEMVNSTSLDVSTSTTLLSGSR